MTLMTTLSLIIAGYIYIITLGPVFLAIIALVAQKGRKSGFYFISGAVLGSMLWLSLTCASLIEADKLPPFIFTILSMLCGFYLLYLGTKMLIHPRRNQEAEQKDIVFQRPFFDGLTLSLLNPKSYPVMISVIGAVLAAQSDLLAWNHYAFIFATSVTGFILGYTTMVFSAGTSIVTRITQHYFQWMMMVFGLIFIGFGFHLLWTTITNSAP